MPRANAFFKMNGNSSCRRSEQAPVNAAKAATSHMHYLKQRALISKQTAKPSLVTAERTDTEQRLFYIFVVFNMS